MCHVRHIDVVLQCGLCEAHQLHRKITRLAKFQTTVQCSHAARTTPIESARQHRLQRCLFVSITPASHQNDVQDPCLGSLVRPWAGVRVKFEGFKT